MLIFILILVFYSSLPSDAKSRRVSISPVKISEVVLSPDPFIIGQSALTMAILVELPPSLNGANVLEVSAMITSPTRRSMSFVAHRRIVDDGETKGKTVPMVLVWDGKDQTRQLVPDGSYFYELQAKLMEDQGNGPRTKVVSRRVHGTLEALAYPGEVLPPLPPEPDVPEELEHLQTEEASGEEAEIPMQEEEVQESEDPEMPEEGSFPDSLENDVEEPRVPEFQSEAGEPEGKGDVSLSGLPHGQVLNP